MIDADKAIPWAEQRTKLVLADSQREAVLIQQRVVDPRRRQARAVDGSPLSGEELSRERCRNVKDARSIFDRGFELAAFVPLVP